MGENSLAALDEHVTRDRSGAQTPSDHGYSPPTSPDAIETSRSHLSHLVERRTA
jgi:hypothetical protein